MTIKSAHVFLVKVLTWMDAFGSCLLVNMPLRCQKKWLETGAWLSFWRFKSCLNGWRWSLVESKMEKIVASSLSKRVHKSHKSKFYPFQANWTCGKTSRLHDNLFDEQSFLRCWHELYKVENCFFIVFKMQFSGFQPLRLSTSFGRAVESLFGLDWVVTKRRKVGS